MPNHRKLPPTKEVLALVDGGASLAEVARMYGASRQAVQWCVRNAGRPAQPVVRYDSLIPWRVKVAHNADPLVRRLRRCAQILAGVQLTERQQLYHDQWLAEIREKGVVVAYDPDLGFHYVPARPGDHLIRRPVG